MILFKSISDSRKAGRIPARAAFTLAEMLIAMTVFLLLVFGIISATLFGMRWFQLAQAKLRPTDQARQAIAKMADEIRSCTSTYVGSVNTNGVFTGLTNGQAQIGSSLLIYPTTNSTNYILYFFNASDQTVRRTSIASGLTTIMAQNVTNAALFQVQDFLGNVQTNNQDNRVIRCTLRFYQDSPDTPVPTCYTLDTAITRRTL
jgi:hypothetical protein